MKSILVLFWDINLFKRGPEDVPAHSVLLISVVTIFVVFNSVASWFLLDTNLLHSLMSSVMVLMVFVASLWLGLQLKGGLNRFPQSVAALLGQDLVISCLSMPVLVMLVAKEAEGSVPQAGSILLLLFYVWDLAVKGFIYRKALDVGPGLALMLAVAMVMSAIVLENQFFGLDADPRATPSSESPTPNIRTLSSAPKLHFLESGLIVSTADALLITG
ncbi:MAG: hypothetical protein KUG82_08315 [Pseudomonadales bacterium]|nr:hypothetical protein [Pseudomonadales bacterium]